MRMQRKPDSEPYTLDWLMRWAMPVPHSGCWVWLGTLNPGGYGSVGYKGKTWNAHRVSYLLAHGALPERHDLDHLCRVRCCINPDHLEAVTRSENLARGLSGENLANPARAKTHCPKGHRYEGLNLYTDTRGRRTCVTCQRQRVRDWRSRQKANGGVA